MTEHLKKQESGTGKEGCPAPDVSAAVGASWRWCRKDMAHARQGRGLINRPGPSGRFLSTRTHLCAQRVTQLEVILDIQIQTLVAGQHGSLACGPRADACGLGLPWIDVLAVTKDRRSSEIHTHYRYLHGIPWDSRNS